MAENNVAVKWARHAAESDAAIMRLVAFIRRVAETTPPDGGDLAAYMTASALQGEAQGIINDYSYLFAPEAPDA